MKNGNLDNYRNELSAQDKYLPYSYHMTDNILSLKDGSMLSVFKVDGRTHDCASENELISWHNDLNMLVKGISSSQVELWSYEWHHETQQHPDGEFSDYFSSYMNEYNKKIHKDKKQFVNELYLAVVYKPLADKTQKFFSKFERPSITDIEEMQKDCIESLEEINDQIQSSMAAYGIKPLGIYYRNKNGDVVTKQEEFDTENDEDTEDDLFAENSAVVSDFPEKSDSHYAFTALGEFLYFLANGEWCHLPVCSGRLADYMMDNRVTFSLWGDVGLIRTSEGNIYTKALEIRDFDKDTEPGQLNTLKEAPFEYLLAQSFCCLSQGAAKSLIEHQEKSLVETKDRSATQLEQLSNALDMLIAGEFVVGESHTTVHLFDKNEDDLNKKSRKLKVMMGQCFIQAGPVSLASEAAYFGKMPGNISWAPRPVPINSWNFLHLSPFHNFLRGKEKNNPWGDALTMFSTVSGSPLFFNYHVTPLDEKSLNKRPLGHTLITGKSGEGKTTLLNFLLAQSMKFKPRIFGYDKDRGMEPFIRSVGGHYKVLSSGIPTGFAPLKLEPTLRNISYIKNLLKICLEITNNGPLTKDEGIELNKAIDSLLGEHSVFSIEQRSMASLKSFVTSEGLKSLVNEWTTEGEFGWVFDNPKDSLDLSINDVFCFDIGDFISAEGEVPHPAKTPILMYLLYRVRDAIDGTRRVIQVFDEFHSYLDDTVTVKEIKRGIKTDRKKDAVYVFSTQEPNDALSSSIGNTVLSQTPTKICLRDDDAEREHYKFLTDSEFRAHQTIPELSREMLVKQGSKSTIAKFDLKISNNDDDMLKMNRILAVLSGEPQNAAIAESMVNEYGAEPEKWLPHYWNKVI